MATDPEITAMAAVSNALADLDESARKRVLDWAANKHGVVLNSGGSQRTSNRGAAGADNNAAGEYEEFVDIFDAAGPQTDVEKALVAAYWFQEIQGQGNFGAQQINDALKDLGHGVGNITQALDALRSRKPSFVNQVGKSGSTRQARKTYKVTKAGSSEVARLLQGMQSDE